MRLLMLIVVLLVCAAGPMVAVAQSTSDESRNNDPYAAIIEEMVRQGYFEIMKARERGDYQTVLSRLLPAAEQSEAWAQFKLGEMYEVGQGVHQDYEEALRWYRKSAAQQYMDAELRLATMYANGWGVGKDFAETLKWLSQLAEAQKLAREWKPTQAIVSPATPTASAPPAQRSTSGSSIPMKKDGGTYVVPVLINNAITLDFTVDSGATDVTIPEDVVTTLIRAGTIRDTDFIGEQIYVLADGSRVKSKTFRIRSLKVGDHVLENVTGSVASTKGSLLLGQSFLGRFKSWSIDNNIDDGVLT